MKGLTRRGDNVGQSGRWGRGDPDEKRYGHEERFHSTDHPESTPAEPPQRQPNADKPVAGRYEGRFAKPGEEAENPPGDKARYPSGGYSDAGGARASGEKRESMDSLFLRTVIP